MRAKNYLSASALLMLSMLTTSGISSAQDNPGVLTQSFSSQATRFDVSPPLRDLAMTQTASVFSPRVTSPPLRPKLAQQVAFAKEGIRPVADGARQTEVLPPVSATVGVNVLGVGVGFFGYSVPDAPTDVNLAVGDTQVVQWVNVSLAVFDKQTGANLLFNGQHSVTGNTLWKGFGGSCETSNSGDIIAQWDKIAHRWVLFQPVFNAPYASCFAISKTPDALGAYYRYQFPQTSGFPDYPKLGVWIDGYYTTQNIFGNSGYIGAQPCAFEKAKMLVGDASAKEVCVLDTSNGTLFDDSMLPGDIDSPELLPPTGTPEVFVGSIDNFASDTHVYKYTMSVNFPAGTATLTGINGSTPISVAAYTPAGFAASIPQLGTTSLLDSLGDRLMYRLALRRTVNSANVPVNSWMVSHTIVSGNSEAMRWYEFRAPNSDLTALSVYQQGTYAPDANYRFMGSLAMDKNGDIAMGYSRSSSSIHPDVYFTGRVPTDPLGSMETEAAIVNQSKATGSQTDTSSRWGDYTSMSIDNDGCTMWYTNQYYTTTTSFNWSTRVASLKFPSCH